MLKNWTAVGALVLALGVALGAFGAHGLKTFLDDYGKDIFQKAVFYHFIHGLGILFVTSIAYNNVIREMTANRICLLLAIGLLLFSGSLYTLALTKIRWLGMVTPLGGTCFIAAWLLLFIELVRPNS